MTLHIHRLDGCAPTPLAHYLKALAVLRLVSEQRDPKARGFWREEAFWLATELSREELVRFFLEDYSPTPILSPWNGGSGFYYPGDPALTPIEKSTAPRFADFRKGIGVSRTVCAPLAEAISKVKTAEAAAKNEGKSNEAAAAALNAAKAERDRCKEALLGACRRSWQAGLLEWFDAALALDTNAMASWPALLGSGGNDGRLDFTNNSMQHLVALFDCANPTGKAREFAAPLVRASLFAEAAPGLMEKAVGQFFPGSAGGDNMGRGFSGESLANPWDFIFGLEGTLLFASSVSRAFDSADLPQAAAPFALHSSGSGYGSAASADEGPRGEQWMPLWSHPALHTEVRGMFSEGRIRLGRNTSTRAVDAARALARMGAARGISHFERFGYIERNGQANLAVPLGRWAVASQPHEELLDDVGGWSGRLRSFARDKQAPKAITSAARCLDEAILAACASGEDPRRWQDVLLALGDAEAALTRSPSKAGDPIRGLAPLPPLRPAWLAAANDGSCELRLAAALASQEVFLRFQGRAVVENIRAHWLPIDRSHAPSRFHVERHAARFAKDATGLAHDPDVVCKSDELERDCIALLRRRVQLAPQLAERGLGMIGARGAEAGLADVMAFLSGQVDDARILALAKPLMALAWWKRERPRLDPPTSDGVDAAYAIARITHLSAPLERSESINITLDPEPISRLAGGDLAGAIAVCLRRLRASGLSPVVRAVAGDAGYARRLAASLAFPIRPSDINRCTNLVTKPHQFEESLHVR